MLHPVTRPRRWRWLAGPMLLVLATIAQAAQTYTVTTPDGVAIAVQESGDPDGPPVVLVHGLLGSHLSWEAQVSDPALRGYRLIRYDMRGHGLSGKPEQAEAYTDGRRWADELHAVISASGARQPVLVGWSLGAAVISNYLAAHGDDAIAGAMYVGGVIELDPRQIASQPEVYRDLAADDLRTHLDAERAFLALCFQSRPDAVTFQRLLANAALASGHMQRAVHRMSVDAGGGLPRLRKPLLLLYGGKDALVLPEPSIRRALALKADARVLVYPDSGHAPFLEEAGRFGRDLAAFVDTVSAR